MARDDTTGRFNRLRGAFRQLWTAKAPVLSLGLAIVWLAIHLAIEIGFAGQLDRARAELDRAVEYFIEHPMLRIEPRLLPHGSARSV